MAESGNPKLSLNLNLRQLRNQAKDLRKAHQNGDPKSAQRIAANHPRFASASESIASGRFSLADAQLVIARELGFPSWAQLKKHVENQSIARLGMHEAVKANVEAVKSVYQRAPGSVNELSELGHPPLYTAALYGNHEAVEFLLDHGARCDLFACAYLDRVSDAQKLLQDDSKLVDARASDGMTPLHYAARAGNSDISALLIRNGANVNARDNDGATPLLEACHGGPWKSEPDDATIKLLLNHGAEVDFHAAAALGRNDLIESLLESNGEAIDDVNERGQTALFLAAKSNRLETVRLLVDRGANLNLADAVGTAALHRTSQECSDELIQCLIDHGADAHLSCYAACGDEDGLRAALARKPEAANDVYYEFTAVQYAIHSWQLGALRILLQHGCKLTDEDQQHILRISNDDRQLLADLMSLQDVR